MKLRKFALIILIFTVLFTNGMQCKDSAEERRLRRNERREGKRLRSQERSRRLRTQREKVTAQENVFYPEIVDITPVMPAVPGPQRPEEVVREATRLQRQMAHNRLHNQHRRNQVPQQVQIENGLMTTTETEDESTTVTTSTSFDNLYYETNTSNITWSGDRDLMSINSTNNDTYLFDEYNSTFSNEALGNETNINMTSTPKPPRTTPDPRTLNAFRLKTRYVNVSFYYL